MSHDQLKEKAAPELDALFTFSPVSLVSGITIPVRMFYLIKEILTSGVEDEVGPGEAVWASMNTLCIMRHVESKNKITPTIWKHANAGPKN